MPNMYFMCFTKLAYAIGSLFLLGASFVYFVSAMLFVAISYLELRFDEMSIITLAFFIFTGISYLISSFYIARWTKHLWNKAIAPIKNASDDKAGDA